MGKNIIGAQVKYYRERANVTQMDLAAHLGYSSRTSITKIENGENDIPLSKVQMIADFLGVNPIVFFKPIPTGRNYDEFLPFLAQASESTLESVRKLLDMPAYTVEKRGGLSETTA